MAKTLIVLCLAFLFILNMSAVARADDALKKLGRGLCNMVTFPLELPWQVSKVNNTDGPTAAVTYGALKGAGMVFVRAVVGVYEVVTFPFPVPKDFRPILTDPEFMFEDRSW